MKSGFIDLTTVRKSYPPLALLAKILTISLSLSVIRPLPSLSQSGSYRINWFRLANDLEAAEATLDTNSFFSPKITFIRTSLARYRLGVVRANDYGENQMSVKALCKASKAVAGVNANFFDEQGNALGLIISRGIVLQRIHKGGNTLTGIFQVSRDSARIVNRSNFSAESVLEAVQAGPRLLSGGAPVAGLRHSSPSKRSGVCIDEEKRIVIFSSASASGISAPDLQYLLKNPAIGCVDALNLDGGGSAQLYVGRDLPGETKREEIYHPGQDDVPVILALFKRD